MAAAALMAGLGFASSASAKSLAEGSIPVNFPPASYEGRSFVDNDGCVYLRAGVDGNVTWVPRVSRTRRVICGQTPTFGAPSRVAAAPAQSAAPVPSATPVPAAAPAQAPRQARAAAAQQPAAAPQPTAAPRTVRRVAAAPVLAAPARAAPQPTQAAPTTQTAQSQRLGPTGGPGNCPNADAVSNAWHNATGVRCGPQAQSPSSGIRVVSTGAGAAAVATRAARTVSVPAIPKGYEAAFDDGRLNPQRGLPGRVDVVAGVTGTAQGYDLAWTRSKPHRLYDRRTRRVVGHEFPGLTYPNTDVSSITRRDIAATYRATPANRVGETTAQAAAGPAATTQATGQSPVIATRSAPAVTAAPARPLANRHIQVATFADMEAAKSAAQKLANAGIPTRIGKYTRQGQKRQVIVLGPFANAADLDRALGITRAQGFTRAFARK
ncbi:MAG: SPOR domain-containing protein [Pseudomonadota bacterium]